jgi:hypothetical protein
LIVGSVQESIDQGASSGRKRPQQVADGHSARHDRG